MIEKIKSIQNPLTVISIFAGLAEIAGTIALATVDVGLQHIFVWFVMAFPTLLVLLFFVTLNFNPRVLYAPSDFRNDDNFLNMLAGGKAISESFQGLTKQLETSKEQIIEETVKEVGAAGEIERAKLTSIVNEQMELIRAKVESTRDSAIETTLASVDGREVLRCITCGLVQFRTESLRCRRCREQLDDARPLPKGAIYPKSALQAEILELLLSSDRSLEPSEVARSVGMSDSATERALDKLIERGLVIVHADAKGKLRLQHIDRPEIGSHVK